MTIKQSTLHQRLFNKLNLKRILIICIAIASFQQFFISSLDTLLTHQLSTFITADIEIASSQRIDAVQQTSINKSLPNEYQRANRIITKTLINYLNEKSRSIELVGVDANYPLRGELVAIDSTGNLRPVDHLLSSTKNGVIISEALNAQTGLYIGNKVTIGSISGIIVGILIKEPDIVIPALSLGERAYVTIETFQQINHSHKYMYHSQFYAFNDPLLRVSTTEQLLANTSIPLIATHGSLGPIKPITIQNTHPELIKLKQNTIQFFSILTALTIILISALILTTIRTFPYVSEANKSPLSMAIQLTGIGILFGGIINQILIQFFIWKYTITLAVAFPKVTTILITFTSIAIILFILLSKITKPISIAAFGIITLIIIAFLFQLNDISFITIAVFIGIILGVSAIGWIIDSILIKNMNQYLNIRLSSINICIVILTCITMIQLNHESNKRSFKNIPNILLSKIPSSNEFISQYNSAQFSPIKIFFLELVGINENHIETHQINESIEVPLHQAQNIGSRESLLSSETIIEGNWFDSTNGILECSIENQFANKLNLKIGDQLTFMVHGYTKKAIVTNIRSINWHAFEPNTPIIIEPPFFKNYPHTLSGGIKVNKQQLPDIQSSLERAFPDGKIINNSDSSNKLSAYLNILSMAIQIGLILHLVFGLLLIFHSEKKPISESSFH